LTNGCSGALDISLRALANPGDNILIPTPGFSVYKCILMANSVEAKEYNLVPEKSWEIDLEHLESQIDAKTVAIVVNDPSNPCGSVYSKDHKLKILQIAAQHRKPIIADEVYHGVVNVLNVWILTGYVYVSIRLCRYSLEILINLLELLLVMNLFSVVVD
jgi:tyrosine aminotransferase